MSRSVPEDWKKFPWKWLILSVVSSMKSILFSWDRATSIARRVILWPINQPFFSFGRLPWRMLGSLGFNQQWISFISISYFLPSVPSLVSFHTVQIRRNHFEMDGFIQWFVLLHILNLICNYPSHFFQGFVRLGPPSRKSLIFGLVCQRNKMHLVFSVGF